ncbi:MAG TPA: hypothetical protein VN642_01840 [Dongiaceae bacterium]|nr:hypothetical protein [Dongiaceae bacterium]
MSIKKLSFMLLSALSLAALLNGCGSSSKEGISNPESVAKVSETACKVCHATSTDPLSGSNILQDFLASPHNKDAAGCQGCHGGGAQHNGIGPIPFPNPVNRCKECHNGTTILGVDVGTFGNSATTAHHKDTFFASAGGPGECGTCHNPHNPLGHFVGGSCVACHAFPQDRTERGNYVNDNNGVRAITVEFTKWSHHVTGVTLNDAHCAACHLEGKAVDGKIVVDTTKHMRDAKVHLRNVDNDADIQWDPAAPNHSNMDNFCMSCHDDNGATSPVSAQIQAFINSNGIAAAGKTASASNPFGDTISNRYDKMQRPAVVDASSQFNTTNNSHHAVKGPKYTGRTRTVGAARRIAEPAAFAANSSAVLWGKRSTIYDSVNAASGAVESTNRAFNALYVPLANANGEAAPRTGSASLGDDSTLHCGDCHTVGQWKVGSSVNAAGAPTSAAIGAHGSNNEYLLRNDKGTDERHAQDAYTVVGGVVIQNNPGAANLVCYNCHSYSRYGSVYSATGSTGPHAGEYDASGRCNSQANTIPFNGYTTGTATDGTQFLSRFMGPVAKGAGIPAFAPGFPLNNANRPTVAEVNPDFGNVLGIQCLNCHNSGLENGYGGIHGSKINTYIDGMGNTQTMRRFLPGLGNTKYVPGTLGGITGGNTSAPVTNTRNTAGPDQTYTYTTGGVSNVTNWEQVESKRRPSDGSAQFAGAGCYTLGDTNPTAATFGQKGLSVDGGKTIPEAFETWGGCDDHNATQGAGDHGVVKRINRPVTY